MGNNYPIVIDNKQLYHSLVVVALPIALQSLIASSLSLVDNLMIGSLGESALAATGLATQLFFIQWMILFGFTSGCSTFMAQFWGVQNIKQIQKVTGFAITICFSSGFLFFIAAAFFPEQVLRIFTNLPEAIEIGSQYMRAGAFCFLCVSITVPLTTALRATQQTAIPLKISGIAFAINTVLNYLLIFGNFGMPALGVVGAAVATVIARVLELTVLIIVIFVRKNKICGKFQDFFGWDRKFARRILNNAIPTTLNEALWGAGTAAYNAVYGRMGITEFAAIQASTTINSMFILAIFSLGDALLILVGQRLGKGELEYAYLLAKKILKIGVIIGAFAGVLLIISSHLIVQFFEFTDEGRMYALNILKVYGIFMVVKLFNGMNVTGTLRAGGDTKYAMTAELCTMWLIGVPIVYVGALWLHLPIYIVVLMAQLEEITKFTLCMKRLTSKKWVRNVIHEI
ncbi:MATE family efflux transporter [Anaerovorax sp. IOR16]|uniref:MATE family efflux transporter n=1 Tax=Anaerovorax sp. IOR16 TaxID=2773458 RepID=UPI0019D05E62|nr:MATE family efflux transporter [Anaerovorax sp. IOR16]